MQRIGSRAQVMHGTAKQTGGGLKKKDLKYNKQDKIVSKKMSTVAKKEKRLQKAGYITKKGIFKLFNKQRGGAGMADHTGTIKVMTYNVLATGATIHQEYFKNNVSKPDQETREQYIVRYQNLINKINDEDCDIVLLQEADRALLNISKCNRNIKKLNKYNIVYTILPKTATCNSITKSFGTAVLYKKDKFKINKINTKNIYSEDRSVFNGKNATLASLKFKGCDKVVNVVSVHMPGNSSIPNTDSNFSPAKNLLNAINDEVKDLGNVIIGGDFNCDLYKEGCGNNLSAEIICRTLNNDRRKFLKIDYDAWSTCTFDYGNHKPARIDHIFYTNDLTTVDRGHVNVNGNGNCTNYKIWHENKIIEKKASDHFLLTASFQI
jgi:endonuclease/exonuclease/phosphatase family metal-dependent hydrolase